MTGYTETIRRYASDDRYTGLLPDADGTGEVGLTADEAGRRLAVRFTLRVSHDKVADIRFQVFGCGFTIAACAAAAELAAGQSLDQLQTLDAAQIDAALGGLPAERSYCADLAVEALHAAVSSARRGATVQTAIHARANEEDHEARVSANDPIYRALMASPAPAGMAAEDRHLFACLLAVAAQESPEVASVLGLEQRAITAILQACFPGTDPAILTRPGESFPLPPPEINPEILSIILDHSPPSDSDQGPPAARWLAHSLAARAARPGHLWVAMGLFARPELTAAIRRHLPSLAAANSQKMRWKRFLFKEVCQLNGGTLCKAPNCGECSDYALCFG